MQNLIATLVLAAAWIPAQASLLYTFNFAALDNNSAASITFSSAGFATPGDVLAYVGGDVNGCAPASIAFDQGFHAFVTPVFGATSCGDGPGPGVDGIFFRTDIDPLSLGAFPSAATAGRQFNDAAGNMYYFYTSGVLTVREADVGVPEPGSLALFGIALGAAGIGGRRRLGQGSQA